MAGGTAGFSASEIAEAQQTKRQLAGVQEGPRGLTTYLILQAHLLFLSETYHY